MPIFRFEIDIDAKGNVTVTPNPASIADGDVLEFHIRSNARRGGLFTAKLPAGENSPFSNPKFDWQSQIPNPQFCDSTVPYSHGAQWPEGVERYTIKVRYESSPAVEIDVVLLKRKVATLA
ncbi:MAG TPA: hypothetical protein VFV49_00620 [Thermoanaerobaculia bacterium]|nr:hypothetical protein [Thermoanaerobaculia bacterium]